MKRSLILGFLMLFAAMGVASTPDESTVSITVYDVDGTTGINDASVTLTPASGTATTVSTGTLGVYTFSSVTTGEYTISVSKTGYVVQSGIALTVDAATEAATVTLTVTPTYTISGAIKNSSSKKLKDVVVTLLSGTTSIGTATTDSLGAYSIASVVAGTYSLNLSKKGYETKDSTPIAVSATVALDTIVMTKVTVSGTVTDSSGTPIRFVQVAFRTSTSTGTSSASFAYDTTDVNGAFSIATDSVRKVYVRTKCMDSATATTFSFDSSTYINQFDTITFPGIDTVITIKKATVIKSSVAGTVTDSATGKGISGVVVSVGSYKDTTDSTGAYLVSSVATGTYTVTATQTGYTSKSTSATVTATALTGVDLALVVKVTITISGIVVDSVGTLLDSVAVTFKTSAGTSLLRDTTGTDGAFSFTTDSLTGTFLLRAISLIRKDTVWDTITLASVNIFDTIVMGTQTTGIIQNWAGVKAAKQLVCVANGILKLNNMTDAGTVRIFNAKGELMVMQSFQPGANVNMQIGKRLSMGNYILRITQKNAVIQKRIVVQ
jgi:hypothetical protein